MAKFVIECPKCGRYAQAKSGFFAKKKVECSCGNLIDVKTDKLSSRVCTHCGNHVVFDQSKGGRAKCPVCHQPVNTQEIQSKTVDFVCQQCGVRLTAGKDARTYTCPVCDHVNDVDEQVKKEQIRNKSIINVIKYEGDNETMVWKHPVEDFNNGSQLIVHESQEAVFFRDGKALDLFKAGRYTLETELLPLLDKLIRLPTDRVSMFHSEVYFVNMATQMAIKWGTDSKVRLFDPMSGIHVELGACGEFNIQVSDSRKLLLRLVGTTGGLKQDQIMGGNSKGFFRSMVMTQVKSYLASVIRENSISVLEIDERLMELSEGLKTKINPKLAEYGLEMTEFYVSRVVTPDDDPNFRKMKEQFAEQYLGVRDEQIKKNVAQAAAQRKAAEAMGDAEVLKIQKAAEAEAYRMQAAAEADEMRMKGYTYQQETARKVGMEAMQNGITGNGGNFGDIASLGVTLGAMGGVVNMTKDALNPVMDTAVQMGQAIGSAVTGSWDCADCGQKNITSKFCPDCGAKKPEPNAGWVCPECGSRGIASKFCPNCGCKKPDEPKDWDCTDCGQKGITSNFCPNCGAKKPADTWNCSECGQADIKTNFCPNCGHKRG